MPDEVDHAIVGDAVASALDENRGARKRRFRWRSRFGYFRGWFDRLRGDRDGSEATHCQCKCHNSPEAAAPLRGLN